MVTGKHILIGIVVILLLFVMSFIGTYNSLQKRDENVNRAWGNIESTLQRRADLIPNLVEVVKGYAKHEKETLLAVQNARSNATQMKISINDLGDAAKMAKFQSAQGDLTQALSKLMAVSENYPNLKANENFLDLQSQLEGTENRINVARQRYNDAVYQLNSLMRTFWGGIVNGFAKLSRKEAFKADAGAKAAPKIKF